MVWLEEEAEVGHLHVSLLLGIHSYRLEHDFKGRGKEVPLDGGEAFAEHVDEGVELVLARQYSH